SDDTTTFVTTTLSYTTLFRSGNGVAGSEERDLRVRTHGPANYPQQAVWGWRQLQMPVIAAIHGVAFGGGFQLALGADMRFLSPEDRKSTRLNSSHDQISYAVF